MWMWSLIKLIAKNQYTLNLININCEKSIYIVDSGSSEIVITRFFYQDGFIIVRFNLRDKEKLKNWWKFYLICNDNIFSSFSFQIFKILRFILNLYLLYFIKSMKNVFEKK